MNTIKTMETHLPCVDCGLPLKKGEFMRCSACEQLNQERLLLEEEDLETDEHV